MGSSGGTSPSFMSKYKSNFEFKFEFKPVGQVKLNVLV